MSVTEIPVRPDRLPARLRQSGEVLCTKVTESIVNSGARRFLFDIAVTVSEIKAPPARILEFPGPKPQEVQNSLACVRLPRDECQDRGTYRARRILEMTVFSIASDNNITAHATAAEAKSIAETEQFASAKELGRLAAKWPAARLVKIWNSLPGQKPVKKFTDRKAAVSRIWAAIQHLNPPTGAQATPVAPKKPQSRKRRAEPVTATTARAGTKTSQVLELLNRPGGAALKDIMAAIGWQAHSVRGFISGTLSKKMGLTVISEKRQDGERVYSID